MKQSMQLSAITISCFLLVQRVAPVNIRRVSRFPTIIIRPWRLEVLRPLYEENSVTHDGVQVRGRLPQGNG